MDKRKFLKISVFGIGSLFTLPLFGKSRIVSGFSGRNFDFRIPELPYSYDALEPFIDAETMKLHHLSHHSAYADQFRKAVNKYSLQGKSAREIISNVSAYPHEIRENGGGYINHKIFWRTLSPSGGGSPKGKLLEALEKEFGSFKDFQNVFSVAAVNFSGSGWIWLVLTDDKKLKITATPNQDNPMMNTAEVKGRPLLLLDLWEHAYYLKYKDSKEEYVSNFWKVVDWRFIEKKFDIFNRK